MSVNYFLQNNIIVIINSLLVKSSSIHILLINICILSTKSSRKLNKRTCWRNSCFSNRWLLYCYYFLRFLYLPLIFDFNYFYFLPKRFLEFIINKISNFYIQSPIKFILSICSQWENLVVIFENRLLRRKSFSFINNWNRLRPYFNNFSRRPNSSFWDWFCFQSIDIISHTNI